MHAGWITEVGCDDVVTVMTLPVCGGLSWQTSICGGYYHGQRETYGSEAFAQAGHEAWIERVGAAPVLSDEAVPA